MKAVIILLMFATSLMAGDVRFVEITRVDALAQLQQLAQINRTAAQSIRLMALAQAISGPTAAQLLKKAEQNLTAISPKNFTNPFWWPAVQNLNYARQQKDSDTITLIYAR